MDPDPLVFAFFPPARLRVPVAAVVLLRPPPFYPSPPASACALDRASWNTMAGASWRWPARTVWQLPVTSGWASSWYVGLRTALRAVQGICIRVPWRCGVRLVLVWCAHEANVPPLHLCSPPDQLSLSLCFCLFGRVLCVYSLLPATRPSVVRCPSPLRPIRLCRSSPGLSCVPWRSLLSPWIATACFA